MPIVTINLFAQKNRLVSNTTQSVMESKTVLMGEMSWIAVSTCRPENETERIKDDNFGFAVSWSSGHYDTNMAQPGAQPDNYQTT